MKPVKQPNGRWKAGARTASGRGAPRVFKTFDTRAEALRWQTEIRAQIQRGAWSAPDDSLTFKQYREQWLRDLDVADSTRTTYGYHLDRLKALDGYRLGQLRRPMLERHLGGLTGAASYRAQTHLVLAIVLKAAVAEGRILTNPLAGVKPPTVQKKEVRILTGEQVRRLLLAVAPQHRVMLMTAVGTGLRQAELFGVRQHRVQFLRRVLAVEEQVVDGRLTGTLKTEASRRRIPLPDLLLEALSAHVKESPDLDLLFARPKGTPWTRSSFNQTVWKPALRAAGLDETLGIHVLRHTYASHLIAQGQHPRVIQARLGHASIVETMDTYGHLFPDSEDSTRQAANSLFLTHGSTAGAPAQDEIGL
jgi:integrase